MKSTYRTVLVGTGGIGGAHVHAIAANPGRTELVAACDVDAARARTFCDRHHVATAYTDYATMLRTERPDISSTSWRK